LSSLSVRRKAMIENSGGKRPFQLVLYDGKWYYMSCITLWV
jgi:hypothetical protein